MLRIALLSLAAAAFAGCFPKTSAAPGPLASQAMESAKGRYADATPEDLENGRQLFVASCGGCHGHPDLAGYPEQKWPATAKRMAVKAGLKDAEAELLTRYVMVARDAAVSSAPR